MHTVFNLWNSEDQLCQASSDDIQLCAEEAEFHPIIRFDDSLSLAFTVTTKTGFLDEAHIMVE